LDLMPRSGGAAWERSDAALKHLRVRGAAFEPFVLHGSRNRLNRRSKYGQVDHPLFTQEIIRLEVFGQHLHAQVEPAGERVPESLRADLQFTRRAASIMNSHQEILSDATHLPDLPCDTNSVMSLHAAPGPLREWPREKVWPFFSAPNQQRPSEMSPSAIM